MVQIVDWYGNIREINPLDFANEEYRYPNDFLMVGTCS